MLRANPSQTQDWLLSQTPQFTLKLDSSSAVYGSSGARIEMTIHHGTIQTFEYKSQGCPHGTIANIRKLIVGKQLHTIGDWRIYLRKNIPDDEAGVREVVDALDKYLPIPQSPAS